MHGLASSPSTNGSGVCGQSTDQRLYTWGQRLARGRAAARDPGPSHNVLAAGGFAQGRESVRLMDLEGSVSQWTDDDRDPYTRAAIRARGERRPYAGRLGFPTDLPG